MDVEEQLANISLKEDERSRKDTSASESNSSRAKSEHGASAGSDADARDRFMKFVTKARQCAEAGDILRAIELNQRAQAIRFSEKLEKRINKMKAFLAEQEESEDEDEGQMKSLGQGFSLHKKLYGKLYSHQKEGVLWLWSLHTLGKGGILADDMGLGKTIQVIAFLAGMFDMDKIKSVMIVVPLSVMPNWLNEFNKWTPGINVMQFHGSSKKEKERALARVRTRGGVLMTTYGLVVTTKEVFAERHGQEFVWDYVILDEGHKIKNPTKTSKSVHQIPARHRVILTGTPVQNNLKELWSLFDYVHQGSLLGTVRTFKMEFENPIIRARERDATAIERKLGQEMAETLKGIIKPYFLRRTKAEVSERRKDGSKGLEMPSMTRKNDLVIWLHLTETQQQIYNDFINLDDVKELLMTKKSPLVALTVLKKICDHPRLLSTRACLQLGLDGEDFDEEALEHPESYESAVTQIDKIPDDVLINESGKMQILVSLLDTFKKEGHKTLVFSQSRRLLNIIQKVITNRGHKVARLDGTITQLTDRDEIVKKFQRDPSYSVFLLTVQVGGVGLTITAADRVVIYDPNWNPATDAQAVDRVYRIGQQKNVVVYRLITCGTVEEKIYRRQVFKDSITRQTTGSAKNPYRYFTKMELKELFSLDDPRFSKTQRQLQDMHGEQRQSDLALDEHIAYLHSLDIFGISDHDLMFRQTQLRDDEDDEVVEVGADVADHNERFIQHRIQKAQMLIAEESSVPVDYEQRNKGVMKFPSTATTYTAPSSGAAQPNSRVVPGPSPLFTQVSVPHMDNSVHMVSDESTNDQDSENPIPEVVDLTTAETDDDVQSWRDVKKETASPMKMPSNSPAKQNKERRVLQPLSSEDIKQRSPSVTSASKGKGKEIVSEELMISPDGRSPIIGLEKIHAHRRMMEEAASQRGSFPSSPVRPGLGSPKSIQRKGLASPSRIQGSPIRGIHSPSKFVTSPASPSHIYTARDPGLRKSLFPAGATSTPLTSSKGEKAEILVEESPDVLEQTPPINGHKSHLSFSRLSSPLDVSEARRKLSFVVADSPVRSTPNVDESMEVALSPVKKKHKVHTPIGYNSPSKLHSTSSNKDQLNVTQNSALVSNSGDASMASMVEDIKEPDSPYHNILQKSRSLQAALNNSSSMSGAGSPNTFSSRNISNSNLDKSTTNKVSNKRRSVCIGQANLDQSSENDSDEKKEDKQISSEGEENNENDNFNEDEELEEESEEELDKENDPLAMRRGGGRNRIESDSGSESGSCFEVEESEEDDVECQFLSGEEENGDEANEDIPEETENIQAEDSSDKNVDPDGGENYGAADEKKLDEEECEEMDEDQNERFQNLIIVARTMYKQKKYAESLMYVEEALQISEEPGLKEMAEKIRSKVEASQK